MDEADAHGLVLAAVRLEPLPVDDGAGMARGNDQVLDHVAPHEDEALGARVRQLEVDGTTAASSTTSTATAATVIVIVTVVVGGGAVAADGRSRRGGRRGSRDDGARRRDRRGGGLGMMVLLLATILVELLLLLLLLMISRADAETRARTTGRIAAHTTTTVGSQASRRVACTIVMVMVVFVDSRSARCLGDNRRHRHPANDGRGGRR